MGFSCNSRATNRSMAVAVGALALLLPGARAGADPAGVTTRVSVGTGGAQAGAGSLAVPSLSADGRFVAFHSRAASLVPGDTNGVDDVFVHDRQTATTSRVSVASDGTQGNAGSFFPRMSANGRFVVFGSGASNLVPDDTNGLPSPTTTTAITGRDVFVHDRQTGQTTRVSVATGGGEGGCLGSEDTHLPCGGGIALADASISGDGRFVAFAGNANNLVPGDTNGATDIFVHDRASVTTTRVNLSPTGGQAAGGGTATTAGSSIAPTISDDGRYVTFLSNATNLVAGDTNSRSDVFVRDLVAATTTRANLAPSGAQATGGTATSGANFPRGLAPPAISADGRFVAFASDATNLAAADANDTFDVFVRDRQAGSTTRVSVGPGGVEANAGSFYLSISGDGRIVAFDSPATNLVANDTNGASDVFAHDRATGTTTRVSEGAGGTQGDAGSFFSATNADGRFVAFSSEAANLVPADTNDGPDVFVHARLPALGGVGGYRLVASDGGIFAFGDARFLGSTGNIRLNQPVVGMASTPTGQGYWLVASDGGIFAFGDARFFGSTGSIRLNRPIVGMAATPTGQGYWLVASDGGIFAFGDARFFGSTGSLRLNRPVVGMAATPTGRGYLLVASDGGIFAFGDARFSGSTGNIRLNQPVVGMASSSTGSGYWLVASDGGIFAFGDARFLGSTGNIRLNRPVVNMASTPSGQGYLLVASDGGIFAFGDARFLGSTGNIRLNQPVVGMATT